MTLLELYQRAENEHLEVDNFKMREVTSVSFPEGWIAVDYSKIQSNIQEKEILAHEIGHCETGSFYNIRSRLNTRARCERKADKQAISILVPEDEFFAFFQNGCNECHELAELFDVSCEFMNKAMEYYHNIQLARENG